MRARLASFGVREGLVSERARAAEQVATLEREYAALVAASEDSNADDEHDPEGATIGFERAQLAAVIDAARARVAALDAAIERVDAGGYGTCETCGGPIAPERLEALPATRRCIACAR
jgi:RNA polymerase-binding transcription factor DksA